MAIENITVKAEFLFELPSKQAWVNRVPEILPKKTELAEKWIWIDKNGFVFEIGEDFTAAQKQDSYPCKVYKLIRVKNANTLTP